jgi:peptidoglycan/LPS O-acetylase OafA/YrhL
MKKTRHIKKRNGRQEQAPKKHIRQIDILKGLAIISVILIHTFSDQYLMAIGAPFYIYQAVPVFILVAAFTSTYALVTYQKRTLTQCYDTSIIIRRLKRILGPYLIIWIIQLLIILYIVTLNLNIQFQYLNHFSYHGFDLILNFFSGGQGPGSYFIPVILQQILLIPIFYYLALRSPDYMLVVIFILDLCLEYLAIITGIPPWLYTLLYIRYMFAGALGVWLVFQKDAIPKWLFIGVLASFVYIFAVQYLNFQFWFIYPAWGFFHAFSYFWTVILVILGLRLLPSGSFRGIFTILEKLGKASWHIFLVQMTFLFFLWPIFVQFADSVISVILLPIINLTACLFLGYGFYLLHVYVSRNYSWMNIISS